MSPPNVIEAARPRDAAGVYSRPALYRRTNARITTIADATEIEALLHPAQCIQLSPGQFVGVFATAKAGAVRIYEHACNRGIQLRKEIASNRILIGYVRSGGPVLEHGRAWSPGEMLVVTGAELDLSMLEPSDIVWLDVQLDRLSAPERDELLRTVTPAVFSAPVKGIAIELLFEYVSRFVGRSLPYAQAVQSDSTWRQIGIQLLLRVKEALEAASALGIEAKRQRRSFSLAQRVERFMWENVEEPLRLEQICSNLHCRMRSLIYSFKDSFGLAPIAYMKIRRLNAVHRELMSGKSETRIFDIAADYGFWHMGHFSADYKRMFGTTASETVAASRRGQSA